MFVSCDQVKGHGRVCAVFEQAQEVTELGMLRRLDQIKDKLLESGESGAAILQRSQPHVPVCDAHGGDCVDDHVHRVAGRK